MKKFYGSKSILATPMNKADYNLYRGWNLPENEDGSDEGYLVEYMDGGKSNHSEHVGYISWSPMHVFEKAYQEVSEGVSFGAAIDFARKGHKVARSGWNGSGMFAYIVPAAKYKAQTSMIMDMAHEDGLIPYREYWALFTAQKDVATWSPSGSDSLADDWIIVE